MKRNLLVFSFIIAVVFAMTSCKKEQLVDVNGIVSGKIIDDATNTGIAGVKVTVDSDTATTGSDGSYKISGIASGEHHIIFTKSGYATKKTYITISLSGASSNKSESVDYTQLLNISLYPLTGKAKGQISQTVLNTAGTSTITTAAASATVTLTSSLSDTTYTTTTDANGDYAFDNLPAQGNNNYTYYYINAALGTASGSSEVYYRSYDGYYEACNFSISAVINEYVSSNVDYATSTTVGADVSTALNLIFTQNIALATTISKGTVTLTTASGTAVTAAITSSGSSLIITPAAKLTAATKYIVSGKAYSSDLKYAAFNIYFYTK